MVQLICPRCKKDGGIEILNILPKRQYEILCKQCGTKVIVSGENPASREPRKSASGKSG